MARLSFQGTGASPGVGEGSALLYNPETGTSRFEPSGAIGRVRPTTGVPVPPEQRGDEIERFRTALSRAHVELSGLSDDIGAHVGSEQGAVFEAQALFLQDPSLTGPVEEAVRMHGETVVEAIAHVFEEAAAELDGMTDEYLAARAADIRDVKARLLRLLEGTPNTGLRNITRGTIIIARDLTPSDTVSLPLDLVRGVVLADGTPTAHAAILARGLGLPLVVGAGAGVFEVEAGQAVLVDGNAGTVLVEPCPEDRSIVGGSHAAGWSQVSALDEDDLGAVFTRDGQRVEILGNASTPTEARLARQFGAEGIGLLRTEFLLAAFSGEESEHSAPSEESLAAAYADVFLAAGGGPVTVRVMDAGGDKPLPFLRFAEEANPFLGWRGIRILLDEPELFARQLRAAFHAASRTGIALRLMIPMVSTVEELARARAFVHEVFRGEDIRLAHPLQVGVMIETPAAALMAGALAREAEFFSIGTNDLVQYTLACDRGNPRVAALCRPEHPAVLRLIDMAARAASGAGIPVAVCGEAAGDPTLLPLLLGLGIGELSVGPARLPAVRRAVRTIDRQQASELAARALRCATADEVRGLLPEPSDT